MINKQILVGRAAKDPEIKEFSNGGKVANLLLVTSERWTDKSTREKKEKAEFHSVVFGGGLVDVVEQYVKKGDLLYVEGKKETRDYEKDGEKKYVVETRGLSMQMLGGGGSKDSAAPSRSEQSRPAAQPEPEFADDIPF
jgi:single-strand DNA-binding protein